MINEIIFWIYVLIWAVIVASTVGYQFYNEKAGKVKKREIIAEYILLSYTVALFLLFFFYYLSIGYHILVIPVLFYLGVIITTIALIISLWAIKQWGKFFSYDIAVFEEQGVIETGPYKYIRHPLYSSTIWFFVGLSLILETPLSLISPIFLFIVLDRLARKEEKFMKENVKGYEKYMEKIKYRYIPYLI